MKGQKAKEKAERRTFGFLIFPLLSNIQCILYLYHFPLLLLQLCWLNNTLILVMGANTFVLSKSITQKSLRWQHLVRVSNMGIANSMAWWCYLVIYFTGRQGNTLKDGGTNGAEALLGNQRCRGITGEGPRTATDDDSGWRQRRRWHNFPEQWWLMIHITHERRTYKYNRKERLIEMRKYK